MSVLSVPPLLSQSVCISARYIHRKHADIPMYRWTGGRTDEPTCYQPTIPIWTSKQSPNDCIAFEMVISVPWNIWQGTVRKALCSTQRRTTKRQSQTGMSPQCLPCLAYLISTKKTSVQRTIHSTNTLKKTNRHLRCPVHGDALQSQEEQTVGQTNR